METKFLINTANRVYGILDVSEKTNKRSNVYARTAVSFFLKQHGNTLEAIGKVLQKDHSSICFQLNKHNDQMKFNPLYKKLFIRYETELIKPINQKDFIKEEVKKMIQELIDLQMRTEQIEIFWTECVTIAKERKCHK